MVNKEDIHMKKENVSKILMASAMFIFGTLAPFVRNIAVSSGELALYRAMMAVVLVGVFLLVTKQKISLSEIKKEILLLLLSGAAIGINWILLFEAYKYTTVSVATLSYYFAPVIVMVVCPFLFIFLFYENFILFFAHFLIYTELFAVRILTY